MFMRIETAQHFARKAAAHGRIKALREAEADAEMIKAYDAVLAGTTEELEVLADRLMQIVSSHSLRGTQARQ